MGKAAGEPLHVPLFTREAQDYYSHEHPAGSPVCYYPYSEFHLAGGQRLLSPGQLYTVTVEMDLPETPSNEDVGKCLVLH